MPKFQPSPVSSTVLIVLDETPLTMTAIKWTIQKVLKPCDERLLISIATQVQCKPRLHICHEITIF